MSPKRQSNNISSKRQSNDISPKRQSKNRPQIDEKTLQYKQFDEEKQKKPASSQQMQKRKIVQVVLNKINKKNQNQHDILFSDDIKQIKTTQSKDVSQIKNENQQKQISDQKTAKQSQLPLFKDLIQKVKHKQGVGLFTVSSQSQSLFSNQKKQQITLTSTSTSKTNIFDSNAKVNLFSFQKQKQNNNQQIKQNKKAQENQDAQAQVDSQQFQKEQNIQTDKTKSKANYVYKEACKSLFCKIVKKAKIDKGNLMQNMQICLQQDLNSKINVLRLRTAISKVINFQGLILKKSYFNNLNNSANNAQVSLFKINLKQKQHKIQKHTLKIMVNFFQFSFNAKTTVILLKKYFKIFQKIHPRNYKNKKLQTKKMSIILTNIKLVLSKQNPVKKIQIKNERQLRINLNQKNDVQSQDIYYSFIVFQYTKHIFLIMRNLWDIYRSEFGSFFQNNSLGKLVEACGFFQCDYQFWIN